MCGAELQLLSFPPTSGEEGDGVQIPITTGTISGGLSLSHRGFRVVRVDTCDGCHNIFFSTGGCRVVVVLSSCTCNKFLFRIVCESCRARQRLVMVTPIKF